MELQTNITGGLFDLTEGVKGEQAGKTAPVPFVHPVPDGYVLESSTPCTYACFDCGAELQSRWYKHPTDGLLGRHECVACPWWHTI